MGCNALFCIATHDDDQHVDATGYSWTESTPEQKVIAHVYTPEMVDHETRAMLLAELSALAHEEGG